MNQYKLGRRPIVRNTSVERVMLFTNARDEKRIREWVAHHLILGFTCIYIFDHKSKIPLQQILNGFDPRVIIERCELNTPPKIPLMNRAAYIAKKYNMDWFIYLDADEYIHMNTKDIGNVKSLLQKFTFADSVSLNWVMFGSNHHKTEPQNLLLFEAYTKSETTMNDHVKTFVRPSAVIRAITPHYYEIKTPARMFSIDGTPMTIPYSFHRNNISMQRTLAFVAHYIYQSEEAYIQRKITIPRDDTGKQRELDTNIHILYNNVENHIMRNKYARLLHYFLFKKSKK
jgi:hypothetical protein